MRMELVGDLFDVQQNQNGDMLKSSADINGKYLDDFRVTVHGHDGVKK